MPTKKIVPKKNGGASTFKKSNLSTAGHDSIESNITVEESKLTAFLDSYPQLADGEFLLPNPDEGEGLKIKVFMLETKHFQTVHIPKSSKVGDAIRHILTIH